ncbi:MAG: ArnT family glycosyltransferase [Gemmatimonadaceae bacterium]
MEALRSRFTPAVALSAFLVLYVVLRTVWLPDDVALTAAFLHDSGYIGIVARNLLAGRGYVNDANWLLFLNPPSLPMYFHNANPLYPTLMAGAMGATGWDPARAAAFLSIIGSVLTSLGVFWLVRRFYAGRWFPIGCALLAILLPANWRISFAVLPDSLATGLVLCLLAVVVHADRWWHWAAAGVLFGLAWLTRSSATLIVPAVAFWMISRKGMKPALLNGLVIGAFALLTAFPWLLHTARVRGGPFKSDASFYWLINYHASRTQRAVDQYYRSLEPPPSTAEVLKADAAGLLRAAVKGLPFAVYRAAAGLAEWSKPALVLLVLALGAGAVALARREYLPEWIAGALIWIAAIGALAVRGQDVEMRYYSVGTTLLTIALLAPLANARVGRRLRLAIPVVAYMVLVVPTQDWQIARSLSSVNEDRVALRDALIGASRMSSPESATITNVPYFSTYFTGRRAVSPPYPDKRSLLQVMDRYNASVVVLPTDSLSYYYPGSPQTLAPELEVDQQSGRFTIFRRRQLSE